MTSGEAPAPVLVDPSGTWVHLLGELAGRRVLLVDGTGSRAATVLQEAGALVYLGTERRLASAGVTCGHDAVVLADVPLTAATVAGAHRSLSPGGVLLLVAGNRNSPLAWHDALRRGGARPRTTLTALRAHLERQGLAPRAEYALLRSCASPSTVIELHHPQQAALVLGGTNTLNTGARRLAVDVLTWLVSRQAGAWAFPGLAVLASAQPLGFDPVLGRIGYLGSAEVKLLYGEPITHVDKLYSEAHVAAAEADALDQVQQAWPGLAPRLLERRGPLANRVSWTAGRTLSLDRLAPEEGERWVLRAAALLGELHRRLGSSRQGPALVHGDFWLGNVLVDDAGTQITGVIDWTDATRGDPGADLRFLVDSWALRSGVAADTADRLHAAAREQFDRARLSGG